MKTIKDLVTRAKKLNKTIVFPEAGFSERIMRACLYMSKKKIAKIILIGDESSLILTYKNLNGCEVINPKTSELTIKLKERLYELRKHKGLTIEEANDLILNPFYFSSMLVECGYADGMVGGAEVSTKENLSPALKIIKGREGLVSSMMMFYGKNELTDNMFYLADPALIEKPTFEQLAYIAELVMEEAKKLTNTKARVAFLSYSTHNSANSEDTIKMAEATKLFKKFHPDTISEGEIQLDAALLPEVARIKIPEGKFEGRANIFIVPDINSGNICYKAIQYFGGFKAIGPITIGFNKPVNDLSRGANVEDIINITAVTILQTIKGE